MVEKDNIKDLFSEKLAQHEVPVRPELWQGIASQVGSSSIIGSGLSLGVKVAISIGVVTTISMGILFFKKENTPVQQEIVQVNQSKQVESIKEHNLFSEKSNTELNQTIVEVEDTEPATKEVIQSDFKGQTNNDVEVPTSEQLKPLQVIKPINPIVLAEEDNNTQPSEEQVEEIEAPVIIESQVVEPVETVKHAEITKVPNIFTPNGDRDNDEFFIEYNGELLDYQIVIMNTNNQVVYQTSDPDFKWNGISLSGDQVAEGTYYFILTASDINQNPINKYGQITVRR